MEIKTVVSARQKAIFTFKNLILLIFSSLYLTYPSYAKETILVNRPLSKNDFRGFYAHELLHEVLNKTKQDYGDFHIAYTKKVSPLRAKILMVKEGYGDVLPGATRADWERDLLPVRIPIVKGIQGLRVLLIHQDMQDTFSKLTSIGQLKKLTQGTGYNWSITQTFKTHNFNIATFVEYEALFSMLQKKRFDYASRGVNEVLEEMKIHSLKNPDIQIEQSILLNIPLPVYFFVNPHKPQLAKRITEGLLLAIKDGTLDKLFNEHYGYITTAFNLEKRKLFTIENPNLNPDSPTISPLELIKLGSANNIAPTLD